MSVAKILKTRRKLQPSKYIIQEKLRLEEGYRDLSSYDKKEEAVRRLKEVVEKLGGNVNYDYEIRLVKQERTVIMSPIDLSTLEER